MSSKNSQGLADKTMGSSLRALNWIAGSKILDRLRLRSQFERTVFQSTKHGMRAATSAGRSFNKATSLGKPARQKSGSGSGLFDLTPDDEQQMFIEAGQAFAADQIRPAASGADSEKATPAAILEQAGEIGVNTLGIPEEFDGVLTEQSTVTWTLMAEALAHGDMGIAYAALAPGAAATAIGRWGDPDQQASYLPAFTGENPPAAALAILEPKPLFDPFNPDTRATAGTGGHWILNGVKSMVARPGECELFVVATATGDARPTLFIIESGSDGLTFEAEPAMGLRAASTGRLVLEDVRVPASAMLGEEGDRARIYADCVSGSRIAWSAMFSGTAQAVLDYVIPYVNERQAFGEPISNRQSVAFSVSDIAIETGGMRLANWRAASRADRGESFAREAALARRLAAAKGMDIGSAGVQLLGGHGYVKEHPVERWYRDLRTAGVMEGALLA
ncbi:MAG TPA: acyl-CoA dehydrogenase family protein [Solirubrobacterales bacterium]|nr:acyl-CoA dehydrogenase family protein [Solirubrobacterales bacterium]